MDSPVHDCLSRFMVHLAPLVPLRSDEAVDDDTILRALAKARGHILPEEAADFVAVRPTLANPFPSVPGSERALERIRRAIETKEKIAIIGDYDVDGVVSTILLYEFLSRAGNKAFCFIPDRIEDDYGVTTQAAEKCIEQGNPSLMISVDCGSPSAAVIGKLRDKGIDFIVLDHHEPGHNAQEHPALAHLNPKAWLGTAPVVDEAATLCAGGLTYFFVSYLSAHLPNSGWNADRALVLAGVATVADVMPLTRTNRALVKHSIALASTREGRDLVPGLSLLLERTSACDYSAKNYGWVIGPHLNAAGRVAHAREACNLLATRDPAKLVEMVERLIATNRERKAVQDRVQDEAMAQAETQMRENPARKFLVLFGEDWHPGVVGIVAGRIRERFNLPAIVCGLHPETKGYWKGSARSVRGANLGSIVHAAVAEKVILGGGGHHMAAGVRVGVGGEQGFRDWLEAHCAEMAWDTRSVVEVIGEYTQRAPQEWEELVDVAGPFGNGSPEPVAILADVQISNDFQTLATKTGKPFGLTFSAIAPTGRSYRLSWLGLSSDAEFIAARQYLTSLKSGTFPVRQTMSVRNGMTYRGLELAGLIAA